VTRAKKSEAAGYTHIVHPIPPLYNQESKILILGSLPSVKSREGMFFYHHPQNRFWKMIAAVTESEVPRTIEEKKALILRHGFAMWDVIHECDIIGSSDASIRNAVPNDISRILNEAPIEKIIANGEKSYRMYEKYCYPLTGIHAVRCPSTSPANAATAFDELVKIWKCAMTESENGD